MHTMYIYLYFLSLFFQETFVIDLKKNLLTKIYNLLYLNLNDTKKEKATRTMHRINKT